MKESVALLVVVNWHQGQWKWIFHSLLHRFRISYLVCMLSILRFFVPIHQKTQRVCGNSCQESLTTVFGICLAKNVDRVQQRYTTAATTMKPATFFWTGAAKNVDREHQCPPSSRLVKQRTQGCQQERERRFYSTLRFFSDGPEKTQVHRICNWPCVD